MCPERVRSLLMTAQAYLDMLADLPGMTWAKRWSIYLMLNRRVGGK